MSDTIKLALLFIVAFLVLIGIGIVVRVVIPFLLHHGQWPPPKDPGSD
jgi:hypothetical protein